MLFSQYILIKMWTRSLTFMKMLNNRENELKIENFLWANIYFLISWCCYVNRITLCGTSQPLNTFAGCNIRFVYMLEFAIFCEVYSLRFLYFRYCELICLPSLGRSVKGEGQSLPIFQWAQIKSYSKIPLYLSSTEYIICKQFSFSQSCTSNGIRGVAFSRLIWVRPGQRKRLTYIITAGVYKRI